MSLKAKIEAVIYASEEPVTLAQLMGLLGQEAQRELDERDSAQRTLPLEPEDGSPDLLNHEAISEEDTAQDVAETGPASPEEDPAAAEEIASSPDEPTAPASNDERRVVREEKLRVQRLRACFRDHLEQLITEYATGDRGLEIREVAGGYRFATKPEYHDAVRGFIRSLKPPLKLTLQALETLAVVAYKQPVTAPEVSEIRGVDSGGVLGSLMARKLVTTAGRKQVIGRPILYKTTRDFLLRFGLKDLSELPSIEEFEKMASELAEPLELEAQEETRMSSTPSSITGANLEEEKDATEPQADGDGSTADTIPVDGRLSGPPPAYDQPDADEAEESPAHDSEVQSTTQAGGGSR